MRVAQRSKYGVDQSAMGRLRRTYQGVRYDSLLEVRYAVHLNRLLRAGQIDSWMRQVAVPLHGVSGALVTTWKCDFLVTYPDGHQEWHECKSPATRRRERWRLVEKLFRDEYPERILRMIEDVP